MSIIARFDNITKIYKRSHLWRTTKTLGVADLSLEIQSGEVFGLLGLNGCGKTTTIKLLLGLLYPTSGTVTVLDNVMPNLNSLKRIGYLPEAAYINKYLTGREALHIYAQLSQIPRGERVRRVNDIIVKVGMEKNADRRVSDYSKGMMQRIGIAQALMHDPDLLIMDEPITGLDPLAMQELRQLILWLKSRGKTVLLSSHNIDEASRVCDRVGILVGGRLQRIIPSAEWHNKEVELERLFAETVRQTDNVSAFRFGEGA
jgi:ABC-2 type transport system ATP-binding protein